ncbi:MAG: hypothetical protein OEM02_09345 [Desulfobulbaceae bacterium]|nr:hypothetical protein [Desulfobulbaceae bacterium]
MTWLVFNHHSLPFDTARDADESIPDFLKICLKLNRNGLSTILVDESIDCHWFGLQLADHYFWRDWYNKYKNGLHRDMVRAFRGIATRQPFFSREDDEQGADLFEVTFKDDNSFAALYAAAWHEAPLASMPTRSPWIGSPLGVKVEQLDETGKLQGRKLDILNFYSLDNFECQYTKLSKQRNELLHSGREFYENCRNFFSHLTLCGDAPQQLRDWSTGKTILDQVKESLTRLNMFCEKWLDGVYANYQHELLRKVGLNHKVSGESKSVRGNRKLISLREFWLPEGRKEIFENHIKLSNGYRIHFFVEHQSKRIYVGYIGPHLKLK